MPYNSINSSLQIHVSALHTRFNIIRNATLISLLIAIVFACIMLRRRYIYYNNYFQLYFRLEWWMDYPSFKSPGYAKFFVFLFHMYPSGFDINKSGHTHIDPKTWALLNLSWLHKWIEFLRMINNKKERKRYFFTFIRICSISAIFLYKYRMDVMIFIHFWIWFICFLSIRNIIHQICMYIL